MKEIKAMRGGRTIVDAEQLNKAQLDFFHGLPAVHSIKRMQDAQTRLDLSIAAGEQLKLF